jgi:hypothetical protein
MRICTIFVHADLHTSKCWSWPQKLHVYARVKLCNLMPECAWHLIQQTCSGMKNLQRPGLQSFVCVSKPKTGKASNHKPQLQISCWAAAYLHLAPRYLSNISRRDHLRNGHVCKNHGNGSKRFHFTLCVQLSKSMRKGSRDMNIEWREKMQFFKNQIIMQPLRKIPLLHNDQYR